MPRSDPLSETDYQAIETALSGDARGREFLRQRDRRSRSRAIDKVRRLTGTLRLRLASDDDGEADGLSIRILRRHLREMSDCIRHTRREVAMLGAPEGARPQITRAAGELDAIVETTERATGDILGCAEFIAALIGKLPQEAAATGADILARTTEIVTACAFHDITGQRLSKVVDTLRYLETRVEAMLAIWGDPAGETPRLPAQPGLLLHGPSADGISQADVDKLFV